jgi:hypothetical protein
MESSKQENSICWCKLAPILTDEVYKAHEILSKIRHKLIQNIILSVLVLYKKICYISNIALENQKCVINIVSATVAEAATILPVPPVAHSVKFGGDWRSPLYYYINALCIGMIIKYVKYESSG